MMYSLASHHAVLGDGEGMVADGLAVPAGDAGQAVRDVLDLDVEGRGIQQVQPSSGQHALPGAGRLFAGSLSRLGQDHSVGSRPRT